MQTSLIQQSTHTPPARARSAHVVPAVDSRAPAGDPAPDAAQHRPVRMAVPLAQIHAMLTYNRNAQQSAPAASGIGVDLYA